MRHLLLGNELLLLWRCLVLLLLRWRHDVLHRLLRWNILLLRNHLNWLLIHGLLNKLLDWLPLNGFSIQLLLGS